MFHRRTLSVALLLALAIGMLAGCGTSPVAPARPAHLFTSDGAVHAPVPLTSLEQLRGKKSPKGELTYIVVAEQLTPQGRLIDIVQDAPSDYVDIVTENPFTSGAWRWAFQYYSSGTAIHYGSFELAAAAESTYIANGEVGTGE
jgi:hypothetical protein